MTGTLGISELTFHSDGLGDHELLVRSMTGREAMSQLFEFELVLESTRGPLERAVLEQVLVQPAHLAFGPEEEHRIHGIVHSIQVDPFVDANVPYRAKFVPAVWSLTQSYRSRVFQQLTVPGIVKTVLEGAGFQEGRDFDLFMNRRHLPREYVVQYEETDFQFIARWMEYEGLFFFFEHGDDRAKLVVADSNETFVPLAAHPSVSYNPRLGMVDSLEQISEFGIRLERIPRSLMLRDYNYRAPSIALDVDAPINEAGDGLQVYYGDHFGTVEEGQRLAKVRAEEIDVQREVYLGRSVVREMRTGGRFHLEGYPIEAQDQDYVVTSVTHDVFQPRETEDTAGARGRPYSNTFTVVPLTIPYRAPRVTPTPKITGLMNAKVDGEKDSVAAPIDEYGRYKVVIPFDTVGKPGGRATRWIRMAQPHAGAGYGMHFPLHVGTEVVLAHIDGDPDRPIIVASVPNHETLTPVHSTNATQAMIRTRTGIAMRFENATARKASRK